MLAGITAMPLAVGTLTAVTQTASAQTTGTIEVCKSSANGMLNAGPFVFTLTDPTTGNAVHAPLTVPGGSCSSPQTVRSGPVTVTETSANLPTGDKVTAIQVSPSTRLVTGSKSLANRTVTVRVPAGSTIANETKVTYVNKVPPGSLKICKYSTAANLQGLSYTFQVNNGTPFSVTAGSSEATANCSSLMNFPVGTNVPVAELNLPNGAYHVASITASGSGTLSGTNLASGTTTVTIEPGTTAVYYDNQPNPVPQTGYLKVCKDASDIYVTGTFQFRITDSSGASQTVSAVTGQCSQVATVTAGNVTITEAAKSPYYLDHVTVTSQAGSLVSQNPTNRSAVVNVPVSSSTLNTVVAHFVNDTRMGQLEVCKTITATSGDLAGQTFTLNLSENFASTTNATATGTVSVVAGAAGSQACANTINLPVGTIVTVTEASPGTAANGAGYQAISGNGATLTIAAGDNIANVTNQAMGTLKVCKVLYNQVVTAAPSFPFTVTDSSGNVTTFSLTSGQCKVVTAAAGTATITESPVSGYHIYTISGASSVNGSTATVQVSALPGTAVVTYYNITNLETFEICKYIDPSSGDSLNNYTFNFTWADSNGSGGSASVKPGFCTPPIQVYVLQANGSANQVTVTETGATPPAGTTPIPWHLQSTQVTAPGTQVGSTTFTPTGGSNTFKVGSANGSDFQDNFTNAVG